MSELKVPVVPLILALAVVLAGCGGGPSPAQPAEPATTSPPPAKVAPQPGPVDLGDARAYVALATTDVTVRSRPRGGRIVGLFPQTTPWGSPTAFLVREARRDARGEVWLKVLVPRRPNGSSGWLPRDQVKLRPLDYSVQVDLSQRTVRLLRGGRAVRTWQAGIGRAWTPTPTGSFYVTVKLRPPQISSVYGAWALGLSGYSEVHEQFGTGDGQIALHGTYNPGADLGQEVSNGCVRMDNQAITALAGTLPLGTPVTIQP